MGTHSAWGEDGSVTLITKWGMSTGGLFPPEKMENGAYKTPSKGELAVTQYKGNQMLCSAWENIFPFSKATDDVLFQLGKCNIKSENLEKVIWILGKHSPIIHPSISAVSLHFNLAWERVPWLCLRLDPMAKPPNWVTLNFGLDASNAKVAVQLRLASRFYRRNTPECSGIKVSQLQVQAQAQPSELSPGEVLTLQAPGMTWSAIVVRRSPFGVRSVRWRW